jgi:hypothetical protein
MQNTIHIISNIRAPPLRGGRPIVISLSVHASVTNRVRAVTFCRSRQAFHIWHVGRPHPDNVSRTVDLEL